MLRKKLPLRLIGSLSLTLGIALLSIAAPVNAGSGNTRLKLQLPTKQGHRLGKRQPCAWKANTLLVMPNKPADDETRDSLQDLQGTVTRTIGQGAMTVWEVTFPDTAHFAQAEKELTKDKNFHAVQRDYTLHAKETTNDPYFAQEWHLTALNVPAAWDLTHGSSAAIIAVVDTGVTTTNTDLQGKLFPGYDAVNNTVGTQTDVQGHGTMVSTTAAATANNLITTVGPARLSTIFPIRAGQPSGSFSTGDILDGFNYVINNSPAKLINFSVNGTPPYTIANPFVNSALHTYLKNFHDSGRKGLVFNAAGNDALHDPNPLVPYLIVVSAIDETNTLASFSNYGNPIWFTAPGENIYCTTGTNSVVSVAGTSFASPLACSIAALIWGAKPSLTNTQVETILKNNSVNSGTGWNQYYGYGLPDAAACVTAALASTTTPPVTKQPVKKTKHPNRMWKTH